MRSAECECGARSRAVPHSPLRTAVQSPGSIAAPRSRTSKWRCGPKAWPVAPTPPTGAPGAHPLASPHRYAREVRVHRPHSAAVRDRHEVAPAAVASSPPRSRDRRPRRAPSRPREPGSRCRCGSPRPAGRTRSPRGALTGRRERERGAAWGSSQRAERCVAPQRHPRPCGPSAGSDAVPRRCARRGRRPSAPTGSRARRAGTGAPPRRRRSRRLRERRGAQPARPPAAERGARARAGHAVGASPARRWKARTARAVPGPATPSTVPP